MSSIINLFINSIIQVILFAIAPFIWWLVFWRKNEPFSAWLGFKKIKIENKNRFAAIFVARHNGLGHVEAYLDYLPGLVQNRILMVLIAALLAAGTIWVFSARRRGLLYVPILKRGKI